MTADDHMRRIDGVLDAAYQRLGMPAPPTRNGRPVRAMMLEELPPRDDEEFIIWLEAWRAMMKILFHEGAHPERVIKRLFAFTWAVDREQLANMTQTDLALMFQETRAAVSHRINLLFSDYLKANKFKCTRVSGQKSETARTISAAKAKNNKNRKAGRKKGDRKP